MKKTFGLILTLALLLCMASAGSESSLSGDWYTDLSGIPMQMTLGEDGAFTMSIPGYVPETGTWEEKDDAVSLNGVEPPDLTVLLEEKLFWQTQFAVFAREKADTYEPAAVLTDVPENVCNGYWRCVYVDVDGVAYPAQTLNDKTDLYVEGSAAILGGPVFRDAQVKMEHENGGLACRVEGASVQLQLQEDSLLRLTLSFENEEMRWYFLPEYIPGMEAETDGE